MGDISTHAGISHFVAGQITSAVPAALVPAEHYAYLEFGNYLTDVSQFRDPVAHHAGRVKTHKMALSTAAFNIFGLTGGWSVAAAPVSLALSPVTIPFTYILGLTGWTHRLWGQKEPEAQRHGALAEFFRRLSLGVAHQTLSAEGRAATDKAIEDINRVRRAAGRPELPDRGPGEFPPMSAAQVDAVHTAHFTQYWPHEHLDFPIVEDAEHHRDLDRFKPSPRKVQTYLEEHIEAIAQQLAKLEQDWVQAASGAADDRRDLMVRLGHLLHAVEDWWFHSNFCELYRWNRVRAAQPALDPTVAADLDALLAAALADGGVADSTEQRRLLRRRLRYPVYDGDELGDVDDTTSLDGTQFVFTGGFGETDIFHTLGKALEGMEHGPSSRVTAALANADVTLFRVLFREQVRRDMVRDEDETKMADEHEKELKAGEIHRKLDALHTSGWLCDRAWEEFKRAFDLDKEVEEEWSLFPGCGGMIIQLTSMMQEERTKSGKRQSELNADPTSPRGIATTNEASGENIGTHSLLAKDTTTSEPFRDDAVRLAKHASGSVAHHLLARVASGAPADQGIDWLPLLQFYLPFPDAAAGTWWSQVVGNPTPASTPQPDVTTVAAQPTVVMLGPSNEPAKLAALRAGGRLTELEEYYRGFED